MKNLLLSFILLLTNIIYCQYKEVDWNNYGIKDEVIKCTAVSCINGIFSQMEKVKCSNCAEWADSYRESRGCDVCHNNKYISKRVTHTCYTCNGLGKVKNIHYTKENIAKRERIKDNESKCEELQTLPFPDKNQIARDLIGKKISTWNFDKLEEFTDINSYNDTKNINCDNPEESSYKVSVGLWLEDYITKNTYRGDLELKYKYKNHKWLFSEIVSGSVFKFEGVERTSTKSKKIIIKKDDYYFDAPNVKVNEAKSYIEFEITAGKIDILNMFLTDKRKEILGIQSWKYLTYVKAKYDGNEVKEIKIKGDGSTINLTSNDGESFQVAEELIKEMKNRIKH